MKKAFAMLSTVILAGSLIGAPAASASTQDALTKKVQNISMNGYDEFGFFNEVEPNNSFAQANKLQNGDFASGKLTNNDKDYYKLVVDADKEVFLDLIAGTDEEKPSLKLQVDVYNSSQKKITPDFTDKDGGFYASFDALAPGTYYFVVSDTANKNNGVEYFFTATAYTGEPEITRIEGLDRYETAVEIAKAGFEEGNTPEVVLATGLDFPDALAGAPLAYQKDAPILLTKTKTIPDSVKKALTYFGVEHVTILGGQSVVTKDVETQLKKMNITFSRIAGDNRYDTAAEIASELDPSWSDTAFVTYGGNFPDALSVASIAASQGSPILLTKTKELPSETAKALKNYNDSYAIGGTKVISDTVFKKLPKAKRIAGDDRYETSVQVVKQLDVDVFGATLATGQGFADALTGSVLAANWYEPVVLTRKDSLPDPAATLFQDNETMYYTILGGKSAVGDGVEEDIRMLFE
ncbi:cell wall-binding repeat-containing protein [Guptibacillus hwajinpoensis]|uniref:cell wall-binding repeat-containing protein n=1 Tax=Guptibacillus hwajinpoensis TaxID=208199 RepID=UPI0037369485